MKISGLRHSFLLTLVALVTGCAVSVDHVNLAYNIRGAREKLAPAANVKVDVKVADDRADRKLVGKKINGFGSEMGGIASDTDIPGLVKSAIEAELSERGFAHGDAVLVAVTLNKLYNHFKQGFWAGDSIANVDMKVEVKDHAGAAVYSKAISAEGIEASIQIANGNNAKLALEKALWKAVDDLFEDPAFIAALFTAAGVPAQ